MIKGTLKQLQEFFRKKQTAYRAVFSDRENFQAQTVLADLAVYCKAGSSTYHPDAREHARLEGRKEVLLRITQFLRLTDEELMDLYRLHQKSLPQNPQE